MNTKLTIEDILSLAVKFRISDDIFVCKFELSTDEKRWYIEKQYLNYYLPEEKYFSDRMTQNMFMTLEDAIVTAKELATK